MSIIDPSAEVGYVGLTPELRKTDTTTIHAKENVIVSEVFDNKKASQVSNDTLSGDQYLLTPKQLEQVAQQLQDFVGEMNRSLQFSVDKDSGRDVIKVIDKSSGDLVKQYPSEEVLGLVSKLSDMVGSFVDAKA